MAILIEKFFYTRFGRYLCGRFTNHSAGVWWYTSAMEPDMHCKRCDEDLG